MTQPRRFLLIAVLAVAALGATSVIAEPRGSRLKFPQEHLDVLRRFKDTVV